jgi:hypothetical protein
VETLFSNVVLESGDRVYSSSLAGALPVCGHYSFLFACGFVGVGTLQTVAQTVTLPHTVSTITATAGLRAGVEIPFNRVISLRAHADGSFALVHTDLLIDGRTVWSAPRAFATIALGVAVNFR